MHRRRNAAVPVLLLVGTLGLAACEAEDATTDRTVPAPAATGDDMLASDTSAAATVSGRADAGTRGALPTLFSIMLGLQGDMARISRGLWIESYDSVATGAQGIAEHPEIPPDEGRQIADALGEDMARFQELDATVHDLSVQLAEEARAQDLEAMLETDAAIRQACVACHTEFRDRLRAEIGSATPWP